MRCCSECDNKPALSGHPHTVSAPRTPLYQLGWLGEDVPVDVAPTPDFIPELPTIPPDTASPFAWPLPDPSNTGGGIPGFPTAGAAGAAGSLTQWISSLIPKPSPGLQPGPSPRVSSAPCTNYVQDVAGGPLRCATTSSSGIFGSTISLGSALPILAIAGIAYVVVSSIAGGRRR